MADEDVVKSFVRTGRQWFNNILARTEASVTTQTEPIVSRIKPIGRQIVYASSRFPEIRDKYPAFVVGTAATVTSIPVLLRRGRLAGIATGIAGAMFAAGGMKLSEIVEERRSD
ncbi:hypothetical protein TrRE_jg9385 [Triparma retinervis]|uniref:Uncharacterized protein n=1 Tax=Triparma retinervis TaxID=2557542 RepID=A0A9W7DZL2_9STRA|nr:hypothetical protein TrRE_jg9385 [Triparma retinervis]